MYHTTTRPLQYLPGFSPSLLQRIKWFQEHLLALLISMKNNKSFLVFNSSFQIQLPYQNIGLFAEANSIAMLLVSQVFSPGGPTYGAECNSY